MFLFIMCNWLQINYVCVYLCVHASICIACTSNTRVCISADRHSVCHSVWNSKQGLICPYPFKSHFAPKSPRSSHGWLCRDTPPLLCIHTFIDWQGVLDSWLNPRRPPVPLCCSSGATALGASSLCCCHVTNPHRGHIVQGLGKDQSSRTLIATMCNFHPPPSSATSHSFSF